MGEYNRSQLPGLRLALTVVESLEDSKAIYALIRKCEEAEPVRWAGVKTVRQLMACLDTLEPDLYVYASLKCELEGKTRWRVKPLTVSHEWIHGPWIEKSEDAVRSIVLWSNPDQRDEAEAYKTGLLMAQVEQLKKACAQEFASVEQLDNELTSARLTIRRVVETLLEANKGLEKPEQAAYLNEQLQILNALLPQ